MHDTAMLFIVVLTGAFFMGIANTTSRFLLNRLDVAPDVSVVFTMLGAALFCFAADAAISGIPCVSPGFWLPFLATAGLNVLIAQLNTKALKLEDASVVIPLSSTMPVFAIVISWLILGEWPTRWGYAGIVLVAVGSYVLQLKGPKTRLPRPAIRLVMLLPASCRKRVGHGMRFFGAPLLRIASSRGARYAFLVACIGSVSINFDKVSVMESNPRIFCALAYLFVAAVTYGQSRAAGKWQELDKRHFRWLLCQGLLVGFISILMNSGFYFGIVPYVGALKRTGILWTVLFSSFFLKEAHLKVRLAGSGILLIGIVAMAF